MKKRYKILIAIPNNRDVLKSYFVNSLINLYIETNKYHNIEIRVFGATYVEVMRNELMKYAIQTKKDYVFMLDTDQIYPKDSIMKLLSHKKDVIIGYYQRRKIPYLGLQFNTKFAYKPEKTINNKYIIKPNTGLQEIKATGMGGILIKTNILKKLKEPYFKNMIKDNSSYLGEDLYFCKKLNKITKLYCDSDLLYPHELNTAIINNQIIQID